MKKTRVTITYAHARIQTCTPLSPTMPLGPTFPCIPGGPYQSVCVCVQRDDVTLYTTQTTLATSKYKYRNSIRVHIPRHLFDLWFHLDQLLLCHPTGVQLGLNLRGGRNHHKSTYSPMCVQLLNK